MNSAQQKIFFPGIVCFFVAPVEPRVRFDLGFLCLSFFLVDKLSQVIVPNELVKKKLQNSVILSFVPLLLVKGTLPSLIAPFGVPSHGVRLFKVRLVLNLGEELVNWFLENHIDPLPHTALVINRVFLSFFERPFTPGVIL